MVNRVPCDNCGNLVVASSRLCPVCRKDPSNGCASFVSLLCCGILAIMVAYSIGYKIPILECIKMDGSYKCGRGDVVIDKNSGTAESR